MTKAAVDGDSEFPAEPLASGLVPLTHFERFIFGLGPENNAPRHAQPSSFLRTSDQGTADAGLATCSAHRRSSSAH